jgi:hypothetical protein
MVAAFGRVGKHNQSRQDASEEVTLLEDGLEAGQISLGHQQWLMLVEREPVR